MKYDIKKMAIQRGKEIARNKRIKEDNIIKEIIAIHGKEYLGNQDQDNLNMLQLQLNFIYKEKVKEAFVRLIKKWLEEGEKDTQYFFSLEERNFEMSSLVKLNINGQITEEPDDQAFCYKISYCIKIYIYIYIDDTDFFLSIKPNAKFISEECKNMCDGNITLDEINLCSSKLKDYKSPANNGLTCIIYKVFQEDISQFLLEVLFIYLLVRDSTH